MDALLNVGLSNAIVASALALVVWIFSRVWRRPALLHALWLLVFVKLITPPLWPIPVHWPASWQPVAAETTQPMPPLTSPRGSDLARAPEDRALAEAPKGNADPLEEMLVPAGVKAPRAIPAAQRAVPWAVAQGPPWKLLLALSWSAGSLLWWMLAGARMAGFRRLLRYGRLAPPDIQDRARHIARKLALSSCPGVWLLPAPVSPMLWAAGWSRCVLLPSALWDRLPSAQQDCLLAHELAHLRRRDHWVRVLEFVALGLYWWHPVVWWARRELREAEEECCDAWATWALPTAPPVYATALVETLAFLSQSRRPLPVTASGVGQVSHLRRRLTMIMRGKTPRSLSAAGLLALLGLGASLLPFGPVWAQTDVPREARQHEKATQEGEQKNQAPEALPVAPVPETQRETGPEKRTAAGTSGKADDSAPLDLPEQIEDTRDEVDLIKAQLDVKRAQLEATQRGLANAQLRASRLEQLFRTQATNAEAVAEARLEVEMQKTQVRIKQAELVEPEVRLRGAQRRLSNLLKRQHERPAHYTGAVDKLKSEIALAKKDLLEDKENLENYRRLVKKGFATQEQLRGKELAVAASEYNLRSKEAQLREIEEFANVKHAPGSESVAREEPKQPDLEKRLAALSRELDLLRSELTPKSLRFVLNTDTAKIPFAVDVSRVTDIKEVVLFSSTDEGRTWKRAAVAKPEEGEFTFRAPKDGLYWFTVGIIDQQGKQQPADMSNTRPLLKLRVEAQKDAPGQTDSATKRN